MIAQTRPDDQVIGFGYDNAGSLTAVTPPGRPTHRFTLTPVDLLARYDSPAVDGAAATTYTYSLDREAKRLRGRTGRSWNGV